VKPKLVAHFGETFEREVVLMSYREFEAKLANLSPGSRIAASVIEEAADLSGVAIGS
jgi:hypothetical protein